MNNEIESNELGIKRKVLVGTMLNLFSRLRSEIFISGCMVISPGFSGFFCLFIIIFVIYLFLK